MTNGHQKLHIFKEVNFITSDGCLFGSEINDIYLKKIHTNLLQARFELKIWVSIPAYYQLSHPYFILKTKQKSMNSFYFAWKTICIFISKLYFWLNKTTYTFCYALRSRRLMLKAEIDNCNKDNKKGGM